MSSDSGSVVNAAFIGIFSAAQQPASASRHLPAHGRARLGYDRCRVLLDHYAGLELHQLRHSAATTSATPKSRSSSSWPGPGTRTPAPPCATSNPAAKPSPRSPASSAHPAASTKSFPSLHPLHQCRSAATSLDLRPVLRGPLHRRGPAARGGTPFVVCATAAESGRSGAGAPPVLRRWRHHLPGKSAGGRDHDQRPVRGADREGSRVILLENAQDVGDLFAVTRAGPAPADHDPLADIGGCEADPGPVAHAGHLFPGRAARRRVPGPGPGAWIVAGLGAAAGSGGRLRVGDGGMMPF